MKILIDEDLDPRLRHLFEHDDVFSVQYMGWKHMDNGKLLDTAQTEGFDLVITGDKQMEYQQDWKRRTIEFYIVDRARPMTAEYERQIREDVDRYRP